MSELVSAVRALVKSTTRAANEGPPDPGLGAAVDAVMHAFRPKDAAATRAALKILGEGVMSSRGRRAQVLLLTLGALVEAGAPPQLAWPSIDHKLAATLSGAARFARACIERSGLSRLSDAVEASASTVRKDLPRDAAAWAILRAQFMAANACLTRTPKLRTQVKAATALQRALGRAALLAEQVDEVRAFKRIQSLCRDESLLVVHPGLGLGYRFMIRDLPTNVELCVLVLHAIVGDPNEGFLKGRRPNAKAVATLQHPERVQPGNILLDVPFRFLAWTALSQDANLPTRPSPAGAENEIPLDGLPADIPSFDGERVLLLEKAATRRSVNVDIPYDGLVPSLKLKARLSAKEVARVLASMAKASHIRSRATHGPAPRPSKKRRATLPAMPRARVKVPTLAVRDGKGRTPTTTAGRTKGATKKGILRTR